MKDGRIEFFRHMDLDSQTMKLINTFQEMKKQMINDDKDDYSNGKIFKDEK